MPPLRVVGAGLGRTGTNSLKVALEQLLGGPCYHMLEVFPRPEHMPIWTAAGRGERVDWDALLDGFVAAVDWPASGFWPELAAHYPDALVLLSTRPAEAWWKSADATIFGSLRGRQDGPMKDMIDALFGSRFTLEINDRDACIAAYEKHNAEVRAKVPAARLLEWSPGDGWEPLCARLGVPVPDAPFPYVNTTEQFQERARARAAAAQ